MIFTSLVGASRADVRRRASESRRRSIPGFAAAILGVLGCAEESPPSEWFPGPPFSACVPDSELVATTGFATLATASVSPDDGIDVDDHNDAPRGGVGGGTGATIGGCGAVDATFGRDVAFAQATRAVSNLLAIDGLHADAIEVRLIRIASVDVGDADCVGVELRVGGPTGTVLLGSGTFEDHVGEFRFDGPVTLPIDVTPQPGLCDGGACAEPALMMRIEAPVARIHFDATNTHVLPDSLLAGMVFVDPTGTSGEPTTGGLGAALRDYALAAGATGTTPDELAAAIASFADLRWNGTARVDCEYDRPPNAISVAFALVGN